MANRLLEIKKPKIKSVTYKQGAKHTKPHTPKGTKPPTVKGINKSY